MLFADLYTCQKVMAEYLMQPPSPFKDVRATVAAIASNVHLSEWTLMPTVHHGPDVQEHHGTMAQLCTHANCALLERGLAAAVGVD
mmetsp:Transcript_60589/g.120052  ORF Transcript_60589/g.120052 Transcript_60589/m.120052 type:complete len:86 (-) Transcript_60589:184-441(-)